MTKSLATIPLLTLSLAALLISCVVATDYKLTFESKINQERVIKTDFFLLAECLYSIPDDDFISASLRISLNQKDAKSPPTCHVIGPGPENGGRFALVESTSLYYTDVYLKNIDQVKLTITPLDGQTKPYTLRLVARTTSGDLIPLDQKPSNGKIGFGLTVIDDDPNTNPPPLSHLNVVYCESTATRFGSTFPRLILANKERCTAPDRAVPFGPFRRGYNASQLKAVRVKVLGGTDFADKGQYFTFRSHTGQFKLSKTANIYLAGKKDPLRLPILIDELTHADTPAPYSAVFYTLRTPKEVIKCDVSHLEKNMVFELFRQTARELKAEEAAAAADKSATEAVAKESSGSYGCRLIAQKKPRVKEIWDVEAVMLRPAKGLKFVRHYNNNEKIQIMDTTKSDKWIGTMDAGAERIDRRVVYYSTQQAQLRSPTSVVALPATVIGNVNPKEIPIRFVFKVLVAGAVDKTPVPVSCFHLGKLTRTLRATFFIDDEEADGGISCRMERTFWSLNTNSIHKLSSVQAIINTGEKKIQVLRIAQVQSREGTKDVKVETKEKKAKKQKKPKKNQIAPQ